VEILTSEDVAEPSESRSGRFTGWSGRAAMLPDRPRGRFRKRPGPGYIERLSNERHLPIRRGGRS
jgi:hypothetical protein